MATLDLRELSWTLTGWRPMVWRAGKAAETGWNLPSEFAPIPATIPNSVQYNLRQAGLLPDWLVGENARLCQWVEHYHWDFTTTLPAIEPGTPAVLEARGLDYSGWLLIDGKVIAEFRGALIPHHFDLTAHVADQRPHELSLVFAEPPAEQGQFGYTSHSRFFKPRYNYSWDWCPRFVPLGISDTLLLRTGPDALLELTSLRTHLAENFTTGSLNVTVTAAPTGLASATLTVRLTDKTQTIATVTTPLAAGVNTLRLEQLAIEPWFPNGLGAQRTYQLCIEVTQGEELLWSAQRQVGFKHVAWRACAGAPATAEPWLCVVNGQPVFLQGANWTPATLSYLDTPPERYELLINRYREMGCNVLRVWGGAGLERALFYDLCDQAGILVWQEFPLSSSGLDNWPPEVPSIIDELSNIARSYLQRRAHHVSLLLWCGGNELQGGLDGSKAGVGKPVDVTHPALAALAHVVKELDEERRFLPTSSSGPRFMADEKEWGQGLHHDVHGPWNHTGSLDSWRSYWDHDDALFRSETGMPGASSAEVITAYAGPHSLPADLSNPLYRSINSWWIQWPDYLASGGDAQSLEAYVTWSQTRQAEALAYAARACKERFPACGGFIVWMGHDCFPCPINTAILDIHGQPKPAAVRLAEVFHSPAGRIQAIK